MTGVERLRELGNDYAEHSWSEAGKSRGMLMLNIADQIESERACDADTIENVRLILLRRCKEFGVDTSDCEDGEDVLNNLIETLRPRIMPEGMEWLIEAWPKFEDDAPVKLGDMALIDGDVDMVEAVQIWIHGKPVIYGDNGSQQLEKGDRVKRPAPKVLDADGAEIELGDDLYGCESGRGPFRVSGVLSDSAEVKLMSYLNGSEFTTCAATFTHRAPVLAADGVPLREGEHVYHVETGAELVVKELPKPGMYQAVVVFAPPASHLTSFDPDQLTHQRPVLDADGVPIELGDDLYSVEGGLKIHVSNIDRVNCRIATSAMFALDKWADPSMFTHTKPEPPDSWDALWDDIEDCAVGYESFMRRCRALAERERGE